MADSSKYYYFRLTENFFETEALMILESMADGYLYSNILLKLYAKSLKGNGKLMFNDRIPYNPTILASITRHSVGVIEKSLEIFQELGLIEILDNGAIYMMDIQNFIGRSSTEADRKRDYRNMIEAEKKKDIIKQASGQIEDKCPTNLHQSIEIEYRDRDINNTLCMEPPISMPEPEPVITLPLNTGGEYPVYEKDIEEFSKLYPAVDVLQAVRGMRGWLLTNPAKRKTNKGIMRFLNSWLAKEQDKGRPPADGGTKKTNKFSQFPQREHGQDYYDSLEKELLNMQAGPP